MRTGFKNAYRELVTRSRATWVFLAALFVLWTATGLLCVRLFEASSVERIQASDTLSSLLQIQAALLALLLPVVLLVLQSVDRGRVTAVAFVHAADRSLGLFWLFPIGVWLTARLAFDSAWLQHPAIAIADFVALLMFLCYLLVLLLWTFAGMASPARRRTLTQRVLHKDLEEIYESNRTLFAQRTRFSTSASDLGLAVSTLNPRTVNSSTTRTIRSDRAAVIERVDLAGLKKLLEDIRDRLPVAGEPGPGSSLTMPAPESSTELSCTVHVRPGDRVDYSGSLVTFRGLVPGSVPIEQVVRDVRNCVIFNPQATALTQGVTDLLNSLVTQTANALRSGAETRAREGLEMLSKVLEWSLEHSRGKPLEDDAAGFTSQWFLDTVGILAGTVQRSSSHRIVSLVTDSLLDFSTSLSTWEREHEAQRVLVVAAQVALLADAETERQRIAIYLSTRGLGAARDPDKSVAWSASYAAAVRAALERRDERLTRLLGKAGDEVTSPFDPPALSSSLLGVSEPLNELDNHTAQTHASMILLSTRLFLSAWEKLVAPDREDAWLGALHGPGLRYGIPALSVLQTALSNEFQALIEVEHWEVLSWEPFHGADFLKMNAHISKTFATNADWMSLARREFRRLDLAEYETEQLSSMRFTLRELGKAAEGSSDWVDDAVAAIEEAIREQRVATPIDEDRVRQFVTGWLHGRDRDPEVLSVEERRDESVDAETVFGTNRLVPRDFFVDSDVQADPEDLGLQIGTQMRREAMRFWVNSLAQLCPSETTPRSEAEQRIRSALDSFSERDNAPVVLLVNLRTLRASISDSGIPVVLADSWRVQAAVVADFSRLGDFYVTPRTGDQGPVIVREVDNSLVEELLQQDWVYEDEWEELSDEERRMRLRDRVHIRVLEEYAVRVGDAEQGTVILIED